uniref:Uncharacterized protein n=1 Tax=Glossina brevipalpis TaxID=37001 RepID=A0A1A9W957_9MUSC
MSKNTKFQISNFSTQQLTLFASSTRNINLNMKSPMNTSTTMECSAALQNVDSAIKGLRMFSISYWSPQNMQTKMRKSVWLGGYDSKMYSPFVPVHIRISFSKSLAKCSEPTINKFKVLSELCVFQLLIDFKLPDDLSPIISSIRCFPSCNKDKLANARNGQDMISTHSLIDECTINDTLDTLDKTNLESSCITSVICRTSSCVMFGLAWLGLACLGLAWFHLIILIRGNVAVTTIPIVCCKIMGHRNFKENFAERLRRAKV